MLPFLSIPVLDSSKEDIAFCICNIWLGFIKVSTTGLESVSGLLARFLCPLIQVSSSGIGLYNRRRVIKGAKSSTNRFYFVLPVVL